MILHDSIKSLIFDNNFLDVIGILEAKEKLSLSDVELLSKLYRYEGLYEEEEGLVKNTIVEFPESQYLIERLEWHGRPLFHRDPSKSKLVPRKPLHLERNPDFVPKQETLDKLCFVMGCDSNPIYFNLLIQLIESIKATRYYNDIPICILDCGLNDKDKNFLLNTIKVDKIKDPTKYIDISSINQKYFDESNDCVRSLPAIISIFSRCFIDKIFEEYNYYLFMDVDSWVQDERSLDHFVFNAQKNGLGVVDDVPDYIFREAKSAPVWQSMDVVSSDIYEYLDDKRLVTGSMFCFSNAYFKRFQKLFMRELSNVGSVKFMFDLLMLSFFSHKDGIPILNKAHHFPAQKFNRIRGDSITNKLYVDDFLIGTINLCGSKFDKTRTLYKIYCNDIKREKNLSLHYRVFPLPK